MGLVRPVGQGLWPKGVHLDIVNLSGKLLKIKKGNNGHKNS